MNLKSWCWCQILSKRWKRDIEQFSIHIWAASRIVHTRAAFFFRDAPLTRPAQNVSINDNVPWSAILFVRGTIYSTSEAIFNLRGKSVKIYFWTALLTKIKWRLPRNLSRRSTVLQRCLFPLVLPIYAENIFFQHSTSDNAARLASAQMRSCLIIMERRLRVTDFRH